MAEGDRRHPYQTTSKHFMLSILVRKQENQTMDPAFFRSPLCFPRSYCLPPPPQAGQDIHAPARQLCARRPLPQCPGRFHASTPLFGLGIRSLKWGRGCGGIVLPLPWKTPPLFPLPPCLSAFPSATAPPAGLSSPALLPLNCRLPPSSLPSLPFALLAPAPPLCQHLRSLTSHPGHCSVVPRSALSGPGKCTARTHGRQFPV